MYTSKNKNKTPQKRNVSVYGVWRRRMEDSLVNWSLKADDDLMLDGFRNRPGIHQCIGEHIGKFLDGAIDCNCICNNSALWNKINRLVEGLIASQEEDGYIGTYAKGERFQCNHIDTSTNAWDVWVFKYCLLSLINYYNLKGWEPALEAAMKATDLLIDLFGPEGSINFNRTDGHKGLASGSVLEPIMYLYNITGEKRYLDFAEYIVTYYWERYDPKEPRIMPLLRDRAELRLIGRGKAYEMMSCFIGLLEYYRVTGKNEYLDMIIDARDIIADKMRHITGCPSDFEWFKEPGKICERAYMENCVAFTWMQLNSKLFELTGDDRCIDLIEETAWNHIMGSICPDGSTWAYHMKTTGPKDYRYWSQLKDTKDFKGAPLTCCNTNGERALALVPMYFYTKDEYETININFYGPSKVEIEHADAGKVEIEQKTDFPKTGKIKLILKSKKQKPFNISLRIPEWTDSMVVNGTKYTRDKDKRIQIQIDSNTEIDIFIEMKLRLICPGFVNRGKYVIAYGPLVFAVDSHPEGWRYDQVALKIDREEVLEKVNVKFENGWPYIDMPVYKINYGISEIKIKDIYNNMDTGEVRLRPIMFAGLERKNLEFSQNIKRTDLEYDRNAKLYEYRVLYPAFFV